MNKKFMTLCSVYILVTLIVIVSGCGSSKSNTSPDIAFISNRNFTSLSEYSRIWSMKPDGSIRQLTNATEKHEIYPVLSKDRTTLAFISDRDGSDAIYIANANGTNPVKLTLPGFETKGISLSPDGTKFAYSYNRNIWVKIIGSPDSPLQLTNISAPSYDYAPCWSPDGLQIAFTSNNGSGVETIFIVNSDGSTVNPYTNPLTSGVRDESPAWSPDGTKIAFSSYNREVGSTWKIYICNIDGSPVRLTSHSIYEFSPHWSIDGEYIYFNDNAGEIYKAKVSDGTSQNMTNTDINTALECFTYFPE